ncbi:MAG: transcriptional repressor [Syntrophaceae bacterium]|nr:transcriptional repressor [Syntrophaceae bacterium]
MSLTPEQIDKRVSEFTEVCRREGVKLTYQRLVIFKEIARTEEHPDAETVYKRVRKKLPTISFDTVYRATSTLEKLGVISRLHINSDRMRLDANTRPHHHFVCKKCGLIRDVYIAGLEDFKIPDDISGCDQVQSLHIELKGICCDCVCQQNESDKCYKSKAINGAHAY